VRSSKVGSRGIKFTKFDSKSALIETASGQRHMRTVYLAGPEVFLPDAVAIGHRKKDLCAAYGFEGLYPFDNEISPSLSGERVDRLIYRANERMIRCADFGIFNLTPFRGPSADVGTVFELGMLAGLGKRVFGYTNVSDDLLDRCKLFSELTFDPVQKVWRDPADMAVENFGNADNLMIDNSLIEHGGYPIVRHKTRHGEVFRDLTGFETCLRLATEAISKTA
jgi:nucleoside 2-deoxyribosyltransferase